MGRRRQVIANIVSRGDWFNLRSGYISVSLHKQILAGKPILARPRKRECMEAAKIGPDLMLKLVIKAGRHQI